MKRIILFISLFAIFLTSCNQSTRKKATVEHEGKALFYRKCNVCHIDTRPTKEQAPYLLAPPIMGVMYHVKDRIKADNPADKRKKAIAFIMDYVHNPDSTKSLCEAHAIKRFGIMPSLKASTTQEEIRLIANYLYDNFPPADLDHEGMEKEMH